MKRIICSALAAVMILSLAACSKKQPETSERVTTQGNAVNNLLNSIEAQSTTVPSSLTTTKAVAEK